MQVSGTGSCGALADLDPQVKRRLPRRRLSAIVPHPHHDGAAASAGPGGGPINLSGWVLNSIVKARRVLNTTGGGGGGGRTGGGA